MPPSTFRVVTLAFIGVLCLLHTPPASGDSLSLAERLKFQRIGQAAGITQDVITVVFRDRSGFLWLGTREGLYRFDGSSALRFVHDPDDAGSICDNSIRSLFQDSEGRLWVATNTGGLCRLDPGSFTFRSYRSQPADETTLSHDSVYAVVEDDAGFLWVGTQAGLNRIRPDGESLERIAFDRENPEGPGVEYVSTLYFDPSGSLWVGTVGRGIFRHLTGRAGFERLGAEHGFTDESAFGFLSDSSGNLWVGAASGIFLLRPGASSFEARPLAGQGDDGFVAVTSLLELPGGRILAGSFRDGLYELSAGNPRITHVPAHAGDSPGVLPEGRILALTGYPGGGLLAATWGAGLQRATLASAQFSGFRNAVDSTGVRGALGDVTAIGGDAHNGVWAGSSDRGLFKAVENGSGPEILPFPIGTPTERPSIVSIHPDPAGPLWLGAVEGLIEFDPRSLEAKHYRHDPDDPRSLGTGWVTSILGSAAEGLWIGTGGSGVWFREPGGTLRNFRHDPADEGSISGDYVTAMARDDDGSLWVGTRSNGLNRCRTAPFSCERYGAGGEGMLRHHYVTAIHRDAFGDWWVGTAGGGLHRARRDAGGRITGFEYLGQQQGLQDMNVMSLLDDDDGSLWIGTRQGLARLDRERQRFANYLASDGLISDVFNRGAAARDANRLYFGTVGGIVYLPAGTPFEPGKPPAIAFTQAQNLSTGASLLSPNATLSGLGIRYGEVLQLSFALLDYESGLHQYWYRLRGRPWVPLGSTRQITFGDLAPGRHDLQIRGRGARGQLASLTLPIEVIPPFWMTAWFRLAAVLAVLLLAFAAHRFSMARLQARNLELQRLHDQREQALRKLQASERELSAAAQGLRRLASRLETAKEEERQHISRELHDELGQTLTAAKISLQMLQAESESPGQSERLRSAVEMVSDMISQVRAISLDLRPPLLDEAGLVPALKSELKQVSDRTGMPIELAVQDEFPALGAEMETAVFRVVQEAVSNSLRHSGGSRVVVSLEVHNGELRMRIADDGRGFDVDEVRARALRGEHLGLLGLDERVTALGGTVRLESKPGGGTRLHVRIPLEE